MIDRIIVVFVICFKSFVESNIMLLIAGGEHVAISNFPHSAFVSVKCVTEERTSYFVCGASIVNQKITLTAAHCLFGCGPDTVISTTVGHSHKAHGAKSTVKTYLIHEHYDPVKTANDIALMTLRTIIRFSVNVKRIALMMKPPYFEKAQVAGWGYTDEIKETQINVLKSIDQIVLDECFCRKHVLGMPIGTLCANSIQESDYIARGDSGSALVVRGFIQIGIVSYKVPLVSRSLVVYTDTGYFYDWIKEHAKKLYCPDAKPRPKK